MGMLLGALAFLLIYGWRTLDVTYDAWILSGYVERDVTQHYAGWMLFRDAPWQWPLGLNANLAWPLGCAVSYTDSLPLASILCKALSPLLPETFQFFGWYSLLCYMLQGYAAARLMSLVTDGRIKRLLGVCLFVTAPILLERTFRHTALASQWLVLLSLYLLLKGRREGYVRLPWQYAALCALAIGLHPYFVPMVGGVMLIHLLGCYCKGRRFAAPTLRAAVAVALTVGVGVAIGLLDGTSGTPDNGDYGFFSMNLNALWNPSSYNVASWSRLLAQRPQTRGNYDGFNYLGLGVLLTWAGIAVAWVARAARQPREALRETGAFCKRNWELLLMCAVFAVFAVSNYVTLNGRVLLHLRLPDAVMRLFAMYRASGRMFYPVYYLLMLYAAKRLCALPGKRVACALLCLAVGVQVVDMAPALRQKHADFAAYRESTALVSQPEWDAMAEGRTALLELNRTFSNSWYKYELGAYAGKHHLRTNLTILSRGDTAYFEGQYRQLIDALKAGEGYDPDAIYLTNLDEVRDELLPALDPARFEVLRLDEFTCILPIRAS